jgi:hypothetical protein
MGFLYIESVETKQLISSDDYDMAVKASFLSSVQPHESSVNVTSSPPETLKDNTSTNIKKEDPEKGITTADSTSSSLIGQRVNIVDSNFVRTTTVLDIVCNKEPPSSWIHHWNTSVCWFRSLVYGVLYSTLSQCVSLIHGRFVMM